MLSVRWSGKKPVVVEPALDMLSLMFLDYQRVIMTDVFASSGWLYSLNWPYSEDPERKRLLVELKKKFNILLALHERASFSWHYDGYFVTVITLAFKHIFAGNLSRYKTQFLQELLEHSPLSFCLLEAANLSQSVELVNRINQFVEQDAFSCADAELDYVDNDVS